MDTRIGSNFASLSGKTLNTETKTALFDVGDHAIYWLGITDATAFRCNTYLIADGDQFLLVDPGSRSFFQQVRDRVAQVVDPSRITGLVICHQDPDVGASMVDWLDIVPEATVYTTPRTQVLLPHYGASDYRYHNVSGKPILILPSGQQLRFIEAPFLHFPGAFTTYDETTRFLFSGDIWAALDLDWTLVVDDFESHVNRMDLFHIDYMASNVAARGFVHKLDGLAIDAILPQHGSIIPSAYVPAALNYLRNLRCGLDIVYAGMSGR
ncbi:MAG TPA: MBL fold metallo-hydrolase [Acetobacteraceae bacterium]|jgi:flavorubredoxin